MAGTINVSTLTDGVNTIPIPSIIKGTTLAFAVLDTMANPDVIKSHQNISSITDYGAGNHGLNFINPLPSSNYYVLGGTLSDSGNGAGTLNLRVYGAYNVGPTTKTTSSVRVLMWSGTGLYDTKDTYIVIGGF